jgi:hypothetical protein
MLTGLVSGYTAVAGLSYLHQSSSAPGDFMKSHALRKAVRKRKERKKEGKKKKERQAVHPPPPNLQK